MSFVVVMRLSFYYGIVSVLILFKMEIVNRVSALQKSHNFPDVIAETSQ